MNTGKVRIYELAKELNLDNREILAVCDQLNISVKSHSSTITEAEAVRIRSAAERYFSTQASNKVEPPVAQSVSQKTKSSSSKKAQILEIRKNRPLAEPSKRPEVEAATRQPSLMLRRTPRNRQGYVEPLLNVGNVLPLHMVLIPSGSFLMGSPSDEVDRQNAESPQHNVTLLPFFMGRYPITQAQWRAVAAMPQKGRKLDSEPSRFKGDNHPVEKISWYDAVEFCARLEEHTNRPYRLPTEAEWEYACRAGTTSPFYFGKTLTDEIANYNASSTYANGPKGEYRRETTSVDFFGIANAFGLSDMHGNILEWCQDHWHDNYADAPTNGNAWLSDNETASRVLRGGSWDFYPRHCRSASRFNFRPVFRTAFIGFRVVCSAPRTL